MYRTALIGRTGIASRFASEHAFTTDAGVAPIEIASGDHTRHRLSRSGDRRLDSAIHLITVTQARIPHSIGRASFDEKITEGKSRNEAMRCHLIRRLANHIWRMMIADERRHIASRDIQSAATYLRTMWMFLGTGQAPVVARRHVEPLLTSPIEPDWKLASRNWSVVMHHGSKFGAWSNTHVPAEAAHGLRHPSQRRPSLAHGR